MTRKFKRALIGYDPGAFLAAFEEITKGLAGEKRALEQEIAQFRQTGEELKAEVARYRQEIQALTVPKDATSQQVAAAREQAAGSEKTAVPKDGQAEQDISAVLTKRQAELDKLRADHAVLINDFFAVWQKSISQ